MPNRYKRALLLGLLVMRLGAQAPVTAPPAGESKKEATTKQAPELPPDVIKELGIGPGEDPAAVARGTKDFVTNCAFCHGTSATGGEAGPDLLRSALVLHDEKGDKIGPVILEGRLQKGMPKFPMSAGQIADIAAFLHERIQHAGNRMTYEIHNVITGDARAGEAYFKAQCKSCHSPTGDLSGVAGRYDAVTLQSRFLYPRTYTFPGMPAVGPPPAPVTVTVKLSSGTSYSGMLKHKDDFSVSLNDSNGEYHSWLLDRNPGIQVVVHDPLAGHIALLQKYTDTDMHNILAYLETLK